MGRLDHRATARGAGQDAGPPSRVLQVVQTPPRPVAAAVADCDHITLGGRDWVGLFTPGHTDDHLCLYDEEGGVLLSGDQVLPTITPHISGLIPGDPLLLFIESLDRLSDLPYVETVLPAHGQPFHNLAGRAEEIKVHHDERLERLLEICDAAPPAGPTSSTSHTNCSPRGPGARWPRPRRSPTSSICGIRAHCNAAKRRASCSITTDPPRELVSGARFGPSDRLALAVEVLACRGTDERVQDAASRVKGRRRGRLEWSW